jgi:hypothetical protein
MEEDKQSLSELEEEQLEVEDEGSDQDRGTKESEVAEEASEWGKAQGGQGKTQPWVTERRRRVEHRRP